MLTTGLFEVVPVGRVTIRIRVENLSDLWSARDGKLKEEEVRRVDIMEALVDTGCTMLALPTRYIEMLGLRKNREKNAITTAGPHSAAVFDAVRLTIMDRDCVVEVVEVPDIVPALVGQIPLEALDLVISHLDGTVTGNPAHGGEQVLELL